MNYTPPTHDLVRVVKAHGRTLIILGAPGGGTFDITPEQAVRLGMVVMETGLHHKKDKPMPKDPETIEDRVIKVTVDHLGVDAAKVTENANFVDDLGADSLDKVELVMAFEEEFGIDIPDEKAEKIQTVAQAVAYIALAQVA